MKSEQTAEEMLSGDLALDIDAVNQANPQNPRRITDHKLSQLKASLDKFGDLSGVVFNRRTQKLVGGHQRMKWFSKVADKVHITRQHDSPTKTGTVAEGYITVAGDHFPYREVDWDENTEATAMVAANKHSGEWDDALLSNLLSSVDKDAVELSGFTLQEIESMAAKEEKSEKSDIVPELLERYDYVVIFTKNETERAALHTMLNIQKAKGFKGGNPIGPGKVLDFETFKERIEQ